MTTLLCYTHILVREFKRYVYYIDHHKKTGVQFTIKVYKYPRTTYPAELKKKYYIFHHITNEILEVDSPFNLTESVT